MNITVRVFAPEEVLNVQSIREEIKRTMRQKSGPEVRGEFKKTIQGWEHSPDFTVQHHFGQDSLSTAIFPSGNDARIWELVNAGSPSHPIAARRTRVLRFQSGYRPATSPRVISSRAKVRYGQVITGKAVQHPGFEAREFDKTIAEQYTDIFMADIQDAIGAAGRVTR